LSIGSSNSLGSNASNSSGDLSPSTSPGMFDDPFSPGFYAQSAGLGHAVAFGPFTGATDFDMGALAAAFSAEGVQQTLLKGSAAAVSAPGTPPFGSQLNLLSSGPWSSQSSTSSSNASDMFQFPSVGGSGPSHMGLHGSHNSSLGLTNASVIVQSSWPTFR